MATNPIARPTVTHASSEILGGWKPGGSRRSTERMGIQVVDLFSGCGGMSVGFDAWAQFDGTFRVLGGLDINQDAACTYAHNLGVPCVVQDVRSLANSKSQLSAFLAALQFQATTPVVLIGCAPCQGFSAHRKRYRSHPEDSRNTLIEAFGRIAIAISPDVIVMENVPELLSERYFEVFSDFQRQLMSHGYKVSFAVYNCADFGVPQKRRRAVVVATKRPFTIQQMNAHKDRQTTVRDAIGGLPRVDAGEALGTDPMHRSARHKQTTLDVIRAVAHDGGNRPIGSGPPSLDRVAGFYDVYGRLSWSKPAITITQYARNPASGRYVHPEQDRGLTMREAARLQSFPDNFEFDASLEKVFMQIGEAVPPLFATAIAATVRDYFNEELPVARVTVPTPLV